MLGLDALYPDSPGNALRSRNRLDAAAPIVSTRREILKRSKTDMATGDPREYAAWFAMLSIDGIPCGNRRKALDVGTPA